MFPGEKYEILFKFYLHLFAIEPIGAPPTNTHTQILRNVYGIQIDVQVLIFYTTSMCKYFRFVNRFRTAALQNRFKGGKKEDVEAEDVEDVPFSNLQPCFQPTIAQSNSK